ncbi:MAG: 1-acyl-sn-glycerol-3-phosphate acyltransferase [Myxococcales bacterium]|nr:1-acyl-sn-glycerol-3-phosphate acyltransferase [Myxococcales bacterium]
MLDLARMRRIRLSPRPKVQQLVGYALLMPNYKALPGVDIVFEGVEHLPEHPVVYAMNHTDRYNYFPFQYQLWRSLERYTATWVKGKYYENAFIGQFMERTNNIPTPSKGYILTRDFLSTLGRTPTDGEYAAARRWVDLVAEDADTEDVDLDAIPHAIRSRPRDLLGRRFDPGVEDYAHAVDQLFRAMMREFVALNERTFELGLDLLVFPQGTRSVRLSRGHIGLSQIALRYKQTIVPVGCSGSDRVHPGGSPIAKRGRIVYRFGEPIRYADMSEFHIDADYEPFTAEAERTHRVAFQGYVDAVMERINGLVDPEYQFADDLQSRGVSGADRFV